VTELIWEGKYDNEGRKVAPLKVALPFQTVETVNESAQERQVALDLFSRGGGAEWRNRLIWGDKKYVLPALLAEFAGEVDLIYIDPPFATGADFSFTSQVPNSDTTFMKEPSIIEQKAYRDTWGAGTDSYVRWFRDSVAQLYDLLAPTGSMYVHLDWHIGAYAKVVLDEVFGSASFKNEIVWKRSLPHNDPRKYGAIHDVILYYVKSPSDYVFHSQFTEQSEDYKKSHYTQRDPDGRVYRLQSLSASGSGPARRFGDRVIAPPVGTHWRFSQDRIDELLTQGLIVFTSKGQPNFKRYLDESRGSALQSIWTDINPLNPQASERVNYPTQKPVALVRRIVEVSSNEGDLVLDCFAGSGTTAVAAEGLGRRWIAADLGRFAVHTARKRLLSLAGVRPFVVQNLGKYERQLWQAAEFGENAEVRTRAYRQFILEVFKAKPIEGNVWLHGAKAGRLVHVGTVDAPVTVGDVRQIATEFRRVTGTGASAPGTKAVDILGWDFAFELNEVARQEAANAGIEVRFWRIPREVLERRAVEQGDIRFFELAALGVELTRKQRVVKATLTNFIIPLDDVPEDVQSAISDWSQWIDYWAVDWDNKSDTFHNEWQTYRTRKDPGLHKAATHEYSDAGEFRIVVKVIDILGNDTTKTLTVQVP